MSSPLTPNQKKAAKAFVKELVALDKRCKLPRADFVALVGVPSRTYLSWRTGVLPSEETQVKVRAAANAKLGQLASLSEGLLAFLSVTDPIPF